jgi:8-oxo-dGTP pyrophosphatase MutT (NUDIX family)
MNEEHNPWQTLSSEEKYDNPWINVTEYQVINPSGGRGIYGKVHFKNQAIGVLPLDDELNTWLVGQFRYTLNQYSWEIPEGGGLLGGDPLEAAKRELKEETGMSASTWSPLFEIHLSNSVSNEHGCVYLARNLSFGEAEPEETEQLRVKKLPFEEVYQMVCEGKITDSITIAAVFRVKLLLLENKI